MQLTFVKKTDKIIGFDFGFSSEILGISLSNYSRIETLEARVNIIHSSVSMEKSCANTHTCLDMKVCYFAPVLRIKVNNIPSVGVTGETLISLHA